MRSSMSFKRKALHYLYSSIMLVFIATFVGNILTLGIALPWHTAVFHLISWNRFPAKSHPHPLPDCSLRNVSTFDNALILLAMDDSRYQNVTNLSRIEKIGLANLEGLSPLNTRLVSMVKGDSPLVHIHSKFRDIFFTRTIQNTSKAEVMKDILRTVKRPMDEHYRDLEFRDQESELFQTVKRPMDEHFRDQDSEVLDPIEREEPTAPPDRYESCAVVGNSGVLWNSSRGKEIDSHEMVIRLNNALSKERNRTTVEAHIGTKTTLTFMNSHVLYQCLNKFHRCKCHPYGLNVPIMVYLCTPEHAVGVACCSFEHKTPLFLTDGRYDAFVSRVAAWYSMKHYLDSGQGNITGWEEAHKHEFHYSSGFQAVITALALCEQVDIYGFGKHPNWRHHFHSNQKKEHYSHDFEGEYLFYRDLEANRIYDNPFLCEAGTYIPKVQIFY